MMSLLTKEQALQKLRQYCAYQERCHAEVIDRLYHFGMKKPEVDEITAILIEENYLNEERFAIQFAGGRFRMKKWGRKKIQYELKAKKLSDYCIKKALAQISDEDYISTLQELAAKKWNDLRRENNLLTKMAKVRDFLLQKGYEADLIHDQLQELRKKPEK